MVKKTKENLQEGAGLWSKFKILKDKIKGRQYQQIPNSTNSSSSTNNTKPNQSIRFQNTNIPTLFRVNNNFKYESAKIQKILDSLNKKRREEVGKFVNDNLKKSIPTNKILKDLVQKIDYYGKQNEIRFNELIFKIGDALNEDQREQVFSLVRRYKHKAVSFPFILIHIREKIENMLRKSNKKNKVINMIDEELNLSYQNFVKNYCRNNNDTCKEKWHRYLNDVRIPECLDDAVLDIINDAPITERRILKQMLNNAKKELIRQMKIKPLPLKSNKPNQPNNKLKQRILNLGLNNRYLNDFKKNINLKENEIITDEELKREIARFKTRKQYLRSY